MNMVKTCILLLVIILALFLVVQASSINDKTLSSFKLVKHLLNSKKGDKIRGLDEVKNYLFKYGYFKSSKVARYRKNCFTRHKYNVFDQDLEKAIKKFQLFYHLDVSGILDEKTLSLMVKPLSRYPDLVNQTLTKYGEKLDRDSFRSGSYYVLGNTTWPTTNLTWAVAPRTRSDAISPITSAFQSWANVTAFKFEKIDNYATADVTISFAGVYHYFCGASFLENPRSVACSTPPPQGRLYFRVDVSWADGAQDGKMDIQTVALHEIGHILGLGHSEVPDAVMWPCAGYGVTKRNLHEDDIAGIKELYNFP